MKKLLVLLLSLMMMTVMLTSCGSSDDGGDVESDVIVYGYFTEPIIDWDPSIMYSNGNIVLQNCYEPLLRFDPITKEIEYVLAESYEVSDDMKTWTFNLREGIKFHDGSDFTAEAVKFSFERTRDMGQGPAYMFDCIDEINIIDDYTVEIVLAYDAPLQLIVSGSYGSYIMSPTAIEENGDEWLMDGNECGTGPYVIKSQVMGDEVVFEAFEEYWGGWDDSQYKLAVIKKVGEASSRRQMVEAGDLDITVNLSSEDLEALEDAGTVNIKRSASLQNLMIHMNTENSKLSDEKVRQALSIAFPYNDVIEYALGGQGVQSYGAIPYSLWGNLKGVEEPKEENLEEAQKMLEDAGYAEGELKLMITYMSGEELERKICELYQVELAKIGVDLEIKAMPWDSQWELARATDPDDRQDMYLMYQQPDYASPYSFLQTYFAIEDDINMNLSYYKNEEFDKLIEEGSKLSATDIEKATDNFVEAQQILLEDSPAIFICDIDESYITNGIDDLQNNPLYQGTVFFYNLEK